MGAGSEALARLVARAVLVCLASAWAFAGAAAQSAPFDTLPPPLTAPPTPVLPAPRLTVPPPPAPPGATDAARALPRVVRIASEGARPPYNELDADGALRGFEIDLGRALCQRVRVECVFVSQEWDQMIPGLTAGFYDVILSAMEPTDERHAEVAFGQPYVRMPLTLMGEQEDAAPSAVTPQTLEGKRLGVEAESPQAQWAADRFPQAEIKPYATLEEAILDLASDRVDFVLARKDSADEFLHKRKEGKCCRLLLDAPRDADYLGEGFAMAFRKTDDRLRAAFDKALAEVVADGTFAKVSARYFAYKIL
jgi:polar amino acid transport system substrate-binding protein